VCTSERDGVGCRGLAEAAVVAESDSLGVLTDDIGGAVDADVDDGFGAKDGIGFLT
jgi:hypothetical protein